MADEPYEVDDAGEPIASERAEEVLRRRQNTFKDEVAKTRERLAQLPKNWESRTYREFGDPEVEGLTPQFWIGVILLVLVIGLVTWGILSPDDDEEPEDLLEEYDDFY